MMCPLFQSMLSPQVADGLTTIPKTVLADCISLVRGDKAIVKEHVVSASATAINEDCWPRIPATSDVEEIAVFYISLISGCRSSVISLLIKRLHAAVNKPLLLFMEVDGAYQLSVSFEKDIYSVVLPSHCSDAFIKDMDIRCGSPANLQSLYNRWLCAIVALELSLNEKLQACIRSPWPYLRLSSPHAALALRTSLTSLLQEYDSVQKQLRSSRQPARRIELGNHQYSIRQQILSLIPQL